MVPLGPEQAEQEVAIGHLLLLRVLKFLLEKLSDLGKMEILEQLIELVAYPDREVKEIALWALGQIGNKRARAALERFAGGDDEAVAAAAREALGELEFSSWSFDLMVHVLEGSDVVDDDVPDDDGEDEPDGGESDSDEWPDDFLEIG